MKNNAFRQTNVTFFRGIKHTFSPKQKHADARGVGVVEKK